MAGNSDIQNTFTLISVVIDHNKLNVMTFLSQKTK